MKKEKIPQNQEEAYSSIEDMLFFFFSDIEARKASNLYRDEITARELYFAFLFFFLLRCNVIAHVAKGWVST